MLERPGYTSDDPQQIHLAMEAARTAANVLTEPLDPGDDILWRCFTVLVGGWNV
jgi:hypothetical protein